MTLVTPMHELITFIRELYNTDDPIPLHAPIFTGKEKEYLLDCIDSTFVSSVGPYVDQLETMLCQALGVKHAIAVVNGTSALHIALQVAGVRHGDEVLTQALSFVATANAIRYCGAFPVFLDVDETTKGLSPESVVNFLGRYAETRDEQVVNTRTGRRIAACVPMHTFGHPCRIDELAALCRQYKLAVIEDAAEALGSTYKGHSCGSFGLAGALSFNGNKIITSGGGGAVITNNADFARRVRFLTTTAKKAHPFFYDHTEIGYNYRMPNINAALACAQLDQLDTFVKKKRELACRYKEFLAERTSKFVEEPFGARSNYWLNAVQMADREERNHFLQLASDHHVYTRPPWTLLSDLPMYSRLQTDDLIVSRNMADTLVNVPSGVPL